jgi:hypothetical protein
VYWFNLTDIANNYDESRHLELETDAIPPHFTYVDWSQQGRDLYLSIILDDKARYLKYIDYEDNHPTERTLCSNCDEFGSPTPKRKLFTSGDHNVEIIAEDAAGNRDTYSGILFTV